MKRIGQLLKSAREEQNLSLEDVATKTKIHISKLRDIEEGHQEALPAKVFAVGLIKSYARELKVDLQKVDELCQEVYAEKVEEVIPSPPTPATKEEPSDTQPVGRFQIPKSLSLSLSGLVCLGLIFIIYLVVDKMNSYSKEEEVSRTQIETVTAKQQVDENTQDAETKDAPGTAPVEVKKDPAKPKEKIATIKTPPQPRPEPIKTKEPEQPTVEKIPAVVKEKPVPVVKKEGSKPEPLIEEDDNGFDSEPEAPDVVRSDNKLVVTALEPVRLEIVWSDGYVQVMLLKSLETKTLVFSTPVQVKVNNGGAIKVSYNEAEARVPGSLNQPLELKYP